MRTVMLTKVSIGCSCRHKKADPVLTCVRMTKRQGDNRYHYIGNSG